MSTITYTVIIEIGEQVRRCEKLSKKEAARLIKAGLEHDAEEILWKRSDVPNVLFDYYDTVMYWY